MKKEFVVNRQGKDFVLYAGLLDQAHSEGLKRISTSLVQAPNDENGQLAIVHCEVETAKGIFSGIGDASPQNVGRMIAPHLVRMAECVPLAARMLTREGWRTCEELHIGQQVLAYDVGHDLCRWTPLLGIRIYPEQYEGYRLWSRSFDVRCTPNHTWAIRAGGKRELVEAQHLRAGQGVIVAAPAEGGDHLLGPREAAILGWIATDGTVRHQMVNGCGPYLRLLIRQSKPEQVSVLRALTAGVAHEYRAEGRERDFGAYVSDCLPSYTFELKAEYARYLWNVAGLTDWCDLPALVLRLSADSRAAMLGAMLAGDGSGRHGKRWVFGKKRKPGVMEAFELLATLEGRALGIPRMATRGEVPVRSMRENRLIQAAYLTREPVTIEGVWCPITGFGTWVMNLDGTIAITGNTRAKARALRDAINVGATALEELADFDGSEVSTLPAREPAAAAPSNVRPMRSPQPRPPAATNATQQHQTPPQQQQNAQQQHQQQAHPDLPPSAIPASDQQVERLAKLHAALAREFDEAAGRQLSQEQAAAQIAGLVQLFNAQARGGRQR